MIDYPRRNAGRDEQQVRQRVHQPRGRGDEPRGRESEEDRQRGVSRPAHDEVAKQVLHPPTGMLLVAPGVLGERRPHEGDTDGMEDGEAGEGEQRGVDGRRQERADLGGQRGQRGHRAGNGDNCDMNILNYPTQSLTSRRRLHFFFPHAISINTIHNLITLFTPYQPEKSPNPPAFFFFFSTP